MRRRSTQPRAGRFSHGFVTTGPIAKNFRMSSCCVTTRRLGSGGRRGFAILRRLGLACLPLASLPFRLGMPPAPFDAGAAFLPAFFRTPLILPLDGGA